MSLNEKATLVALEKLMEEYFNPETSNVRKHDIETQLNNFSSQKDSWQMCVYFMAHTSSQYVSMYALTTIETVINRQWHCIEWDIRLELRRKLYTFYIEQNDNAPHFIRNKLAKLLVDFARYEWPALYPEFLTNTVGLLKSERGQLLGLVLLRTLSEELTNQGPDMSSNRRDGLKRLLQQDIPEVFRILISILNNLGTKPRHKPTATPPPSPTQPNSTLNLAQQFSMASFRPNSKAIIQETLATMQHFFTWVELGDVPLHIVGAIFDFTHVSSYAQDDDDICLLAISTANELLYRKCAPPGTHQLFAQLYYNTLELLRNVTGNMCGRIETLSFDFIEKLSELLCLLIEQHLWRLEQEPGFTAVELLSLIYQLTVQLPHLQCYVRYLTVWATFIKQMKPRNDCRYGEALRILISSVLQKMQFTYNYSQLDDINIYETEDENENDFEMFIKTSIEIIAMVAEASPITTVNQVLVPWKSAYDSYCMLQTAVNHVSRTLSLENSEYQRLHYILRDLSSLTQTVARLSNLFIDQGNERSASSSMLINGLISKVIESASISTNLKFYHLKLDDSRIINDFVEVQSQFFAALKTWCIWLSLNGDKTNKYIRQLVDLAVPHLKSAHQEPKKVCHAAAHLFLSLSSTVFPPQLISIPDVAEFIIHAPYLKYFNKETSDVVNSAFCNILIRPWGELSQNDSQKRNMLIGAYFAELTKDFFELTPQTDEIKVKDVVTSCLPVLSNVIEYCNNYPSISKKLLYMGLKSSIEHALVLFPSYSKYNEASNHILIFFLNALSVLQQQIGAEATKHAIEVFLEVAVSEQQTKNLSGLDKLLQILQLVVEAPGNCYKNFLPGILQLCLQNVYPVVMCQANDQPDVIIALLNLLHSILSHRWSYFFVSQVRMGNSPGCSDLTQGVDKTQQPDQLLNILKVFGQSLLQPDINVFRTSLTSLENLNNKWKLYHKDLFRDHLLSQFLTVLLQTLLDKTHNLLTDDILLAIYNMALVNFEGFFTSFLQSFLSNMTVLAQAQKDTLSQNFKQDTDAPSFIRNLQLFINDLCCFHLSNSCLPPGSVVL